MDKMKIVKTKENFDKNKSRSVMSILCNKISILTANALDFTNIKLWHFLIIDFGIS